MQAIFTRSGFVVSYYGSGRIRNASCSTRSQTSHLDREFFGSIAIVLAGVTIMFKTLAVWLAIFIGTIVLASPALAEAGNADEGKKIIFAKCATCHGPDGSGNTPVGKS